MSRSVLSDIIGLIKHALRMFFKIASKTIDLVSSFTKNTFCVCRENQKTKVKVYVNQGKSLSHKKIREAYDISLCFPHELIINEFLKCI
jgi:hypothetical protein